MSHLKTKEIFDPIHGFIKLTPLMQNIIYTWEFGRLYDLHQLGAAYLIYPSAVHKRSEHSLGVSHLAGIMANTLIKSEEVETHKNNGEEYVCIVTAINEEGYLCQIDRFIEICRIAGLVHDLGHGPYSHLYDDHVKPYDEPEHEERGIAILIEMVEKYKLPINSEELEIIKTMIIPPNSDLKYLWYYQIVANKVCDIDVDKIDYIQRDCFHTGLGFGGEWSRLLTMCKVKKCPKTNQKTIAWSFKLQDEIFQLFASRYRLHKHVCGHHTLKAYEFIITKILKMARAEVKHFTDLTDSVVTCRLHEKFRPLQEKIARKEIPMLIGEKKIEKKDEECRYPRQVLDLIFDSFEMGLSSGVENPLINVPYINRNNVVYFMKESDMGLCMPKVHKETVLRLYTTNFDKKGIEHAEKIWKSL